MPLYIDFHEKMPPLPPDALDKMKEQIGTTDGEGVRSIGAYFTTDGQGYCVTEAPDADAVCRSHQRKGLPMSKGDVHEVAAQVF